MLLIPSIDLRGGRCVRLRQGDFAAETRYAPSAHELLMRYRTLGASWLHVVDLDGAKSGTLANREIVLQLASQRAPKIQLGGGVRSAAVIDDLLRHGVDRVVIGSAAIDRPQEVVEWLARFGVERICLAFDVRIADDGQPEVRTHGWLNGAGLSLWQALEPFLAAGLVHVLCTDIARDGALQGPNLGLYQQAVARFPRLRWQASGGVRDAADLRALDVTGCAATISGKALLEEIIPTSELRPFLPNASSPA